MSSPILVSPLLGNTIGNTIGATDSLIVAEWQDPGGKTSKQHPIAPLHVHHQDDEIWYILEGTLCVQLEDAEIEAHAGSAVLAPKGTAHTFWNPGPGRVRYLMVMTSNTYSLIQEIHATEDRSAERLRSLFQKYNSELLLGLAA